MQVIKFQINKLRVATLMLDFQQKWKELLEYIYEKKCLAFILDSKKIILMETGRTFLLFFYFKP